MRIDELKDVASEPHQFNVYMVTNFSTQTQNIANRLTNAFCNSKKRFQSTQSYTSLADLGDVRERLNLRPLIALAKFNPKVLFA